MAIKIENMNTILAFFKTEAAKQVMFMVGLAFSVALGIVLYMSIQAPIYRPLDYQITSQNLSAIVDTLDKAGLRYRIDDRNNLLYVAADDYQSAKLKLSAAGVAKDDSFNYSYLNEQSNLISSQFVENARYLRALESDLAKTIDNIEGVSSARVHIAVPQNSVFADESGKTTASVMLSLAPGFSSDREKIRSIIQIVAASVPGLDPKDVAITDQYGHYLASIDQEGIFSAQQLTYQNNVQNYYEKRIESMIAPILGENKVSVRVYADIDFTQNEEAHEQYDPEKKAIVSEESVDDSDESASGASGAPGSLSNSPDEGGEKSGSSGGSSGGPGQSHKQSIKNYDVGKSVTYKRSNSPNIKSLSVAVVVDNEQVYDPKTKQMVSKPMDQDKLNKIKQLVQASIGFEQNKGDKVTVVNSNFAPVNEFAPIKTHFWETPWFWEYTKKLIGILFGFFFLYLFYRQVVPKSHSEAKSRKVEKMLSGDALKKNKEIEEKIDKLENKLENDPTAQMQGLKQERITQLKQLAQAEPQRIALIIKNWIGH